MSATTITAVENAAYTVEDTLVNMGFLLYTRERTEPTVVVEEDGFTITFDTAIDPEENALAEFTVAIGEQVIGTGMLGHDLVAR